MPDLFQRGNRPGQAQRQPPEHGGIIGQWSRGDAFGRPLILEGRVDARAVAVKPSSTVAMVLRSEGRASEPGGIEACRQSHRAAENQADEEEVPCAHAFRTP